MIRLKGLVAPTEVPTGDSRIFAAGKMTMRPLPVPVMAKFTSGGHENAVVVGKWTELTEGPGGYWATIEMLDPVMVPEVTKAVYMVQQGVMGPSVDLDRDFTVQAIPHPMRPDRKAAYFTEYNVVGVTLVPMPAFSQVHLSVETDPERTLLASAGIDLSNAMIFFDINKTAWDAWPIAPREYKYDADDAVKRIAAWSGIGTKSPSIEHYASTFLWRDGSQAGDTLAQDSFRLPLADIVNGQPHLIYHAVYAAAALLSGAHGGLPNIPQQDQEAMKPVINAIYAKMAQQFGDQSMKSPFDPNRPQQAQEAALTTNDCGCDEFAVSEPYGDVQYADPGYRDNKKRYPIDTPEYIRAAWSYINKESNANKYTPEQLAAIKKKIMMAAEKAGIEISHEAMGDMTLLASVAPVAPPRAWFADPKLKGPTPFTIQANGRVFGHVAEWRKCHIGIGDRCVIPPKSRTNYKYFRLGPVVCDDGTQVACGKVTFGAGHANDQWGVMPSREHYDNSALAAAVVNVGEDQFGIWIAGALTSTMTPEKIAELRRSPLSGDWRPVNGNQELIAALAVNAPGFPVVRERDGSIFSMTGVGMVEPTEGSVPENTTGEEFAVKYTEKIDEIDAKEKERRSRNKAKRLDEVDADRQKLAASAQSTMIARQMDAKFAPIAE